MRIFYLEVLLENCIFYVYGVRYYDWIVNTPAEPGMLFANLASTSKGTHCTSITKKKINDIKEYWTKQRAYEY
jgi:bacteriorhodopsin